MALCALKPIKYQGRDLKVGDPLVPAPEPTLAQQLLRGRYAYDDTQTKATTRPAGSGRAKTTRRPPAA